MITMHDNDMRTIVDLPTTQLHALKRLCEEQKISRAEAVRRAVARMLKESASPRKNAAFGIWKHRRMDSRKFVQSLREEWEGR
jgi:metal-responsive CopG/Arc/MetJ family transcriptional regulator